MIRDLLKDQSKLFWVLHLGGWLLWALVAKFGYTVVLLPEVPPWYFGYCMLISFIGMLLSLLLRYIYRFLWNKALWMQAIAFIAASVAAAYAWM